MDTNKKFIISLTSVAVVAVAAIVSLVIVLAAFSVVAKNSFTVKYTAKGVDALVEGDYAIVSSTNTDAITYTSMGADITFTKADTGEAATKSFANLDNLGFGKGEMLIFKYKFSAASGATNGFTLGIEEIADIPTGMSIKYKYVTDDAQAPLNAAAFTDASLGTQTIAASGTGTTGWVYIAFIVAESQLTDITMSGTIQFNLTAV